MSDPDKHHDHGNQPKFLRQQDLRQNDLHNKPDAFAGELLGEGPEEAGDGFSTLP